ncbi:hypothetical protein NECAME_03704 [Necator americanus]|uniref:Uncharacterized protein n=1 Tax=Necator americanus TaxID=51031 RepID=W2T433_NECAM|nr:hypothetical protein NECAME_03704 [Necator americanus]ETN75732.1 hypothetical protein NECAME_03704 [Necator americanus]
MIVIELPRRSTERRHSAASVGQNPLQQELLYRLIPEKRSSSEDVKDPRSIPLIVPKTHSDPALPQAMKMSILLYRFE